MARWMALALAICAALAHPAAALGALDPQDDLVPQVPQPAQDRLEPPLVEPPTPSSGGSLDLGVAVDVTPADRVVPTASGLVEEVEANSAIEVRPPSTETERMVKTRPLPLLSAGPEAQSPPSSVPAPPLAEAAIVWPDPAMQGSPMPDWSEPAFEAGPMETANPPRPGRPTVVPPSGATGTPAVEPDHGLPLAMLAFFVAPALLAPVIWRSRSNKLLGLLWGWLFTHVEGDAVLANPVRQRLMALIQDSPGISLSDLMASMGMSRSNVSYHLTVLERNGFLEHNLVGRKQHYFALGPQKDGLRSPVQFALLRDERRRRIAEYVIEHPSCIQREISRELRIPTSRVHDHLGKLCDAGLLSRHAQGRRRLLRATQTLLDLCKQEQGLGRPRLPDSSA